MYGVRLAAGVRLGVGVRVRVGVEARLRFKSRSGSGSGFVHGEGGGLLRSELLELYAELYRLPRFPTYEEALQASRQPPEATASCTPTSSRLSADEISLGAPGHAPLCGGARWWARADPGRGVPAEYAGSGL